MVPTSNKTKLRNFLVALALIFTVTPACAQEITDAAEKTAIVKQAEKYLNGITTMQSRFSQANQDGSIDAGVFYLHRPGRLRFQYDAPKKDYIVADGLFVHFWDDSMKNHSNAPIGSTLADFLLKKKISLTGDLKVKNIRRPQPGILVITVVQSKNPEAGDLRLLFNEAPMELTKWRVTDGSGNITEVTLTNSKIGMPLDARLFIFKAPKGYQDEWQSR